MYHLIEFDQAGGGGLAIVHEKWLTPRKKEVFWPPYKDNKTLRRALMKGEEVNRETYTIYGVHRLFHKTDDLDTAERKLILAENTSDLNTTEAEEDAEKLKKSRNKRCQKVLTDFITESDCITEGPTSKKSKKDISISYNVSDTDNDDTTESNVMTKEYSSLMIPPSSLNVQQKDAASNFIKSVDTPQKSTQEREEREFSREIEDVNNNDINSIDYDKKLLLQILGIEKKTLQTVHAISIKLENMQKQISTIQQRKTSDIESIRLSNEQLKLIREYFPIDKKEENRTKKIDVVEDKLSEKKFLKTVAIILIMYLHSTIRSTYKILHMKSIGGNSAHDLIQKILGSLISDEVLCDYSFRGQKSNINGNKNKSFSTLTLCNCIYQATKLTYTNVTNENIKKAISTWLDSARTRLKRQNTSSKNTFVPLEIQLHDIDDDDDDDKET